MEALTVLNLAVSLVIFFLVARSYWVSRKKAQGPGVTVPVNRPIAHRKVSGPTTAKITRQIGYWRPKNGKDAEPFLAAWYERIEPVPEGDPIPADTYVDLTGRRIDGVRFRLLYEPAEEVMEVAKFSPKADQVRTLVTPGTTQTSMSPEEEEKLAAEYELGKNPHIVDDPKVRAAMKRAMGKPDDEPPAAE
jgi:hypothetical protein